MDPKRVTVPSLLARKHSNNKIVSVTAYDYSMAKLIDQAGVDLILVGDSLSTVVQGNDTTLPVTLEEMIYHTRCVARAASRALVVGDLPFLSYQVSKEQAIQSAGRMLKEGGAAAVKLEGGLNAAETIRAITALDIPVVGHVGLTPQSYHRMGGHKVQGRAHGSKEAGSRERVMQDAVAVEEAGAFCIVLEGIPSELAEQITQRLTIPTIGIGAGPHCDGQILVINDLLGMDPGFTPKFVKRYADLAKVITEALSEYAADIGLGTFPAAEHTFSDAQRAPVLRTVKYG